MRGRQTNEREMIAEILRGNARSLRAFYTLFHTPLASYIRHRIGNEEDVQEILQDTLLGALENFRDFAFKSSIFTFLCSIANHKVIDFYRRKKIKHIVFSRLPEVETLLSTMLGPEEAFDGEMVKMKIKESFRRITPRYALILKLKYVQGYSVEEIARTLSISFKSAESQLFRARRAFVDVYI